MLAEHFFHGAIFNTSVKTEVAPFFLNFLAALTKPAGYFDSTQPTALHYDSKTLLTIACAELFFVSRAPADRLSAFRSLSFV